MFFGHLALSKCRILRVATIPAALAFGRKSVLLTAACIALACPMLLAQTTPAPAASSSPAASATTSSAPSFDVATIKPHQGIFQMMGLEYQPDGFAGTVKLSMLVQYAYGLRSEDQVSGAPDWAKTDWFDIQAKMSETDIAEMQKLSPDELQTRRELMLLALLVERFKSKTHSSTKQSPIYELVVAKGGSKLKDAATDPNTVMGKDGKPLGFLRFLKDTSVAHAYTMSALAGFLSQPLAGVGRPVLDKTGLTGNYNFTLSWSPQQNALPETASSPPSPEEAGPIFSALGEVGLKLQPATGPIDIIVIDHVEHPTAN